MDKIHELIKHLDSKPAFGKVELLSKLNPILNEVNGIIARSEGLAVKLKEVDEIKKYDVVYLNTIGIAHYVLVHKTTETEVRGIIISSKQQLHNLYSIEKDRFFKGGYATKTYMVYEMDHCKKCFARKYEDKKEADRIFASLKTYYKGTLNI